MTLFVWLAASVAVGVFAGDCAYDTVSGYLAERASKPRREAALESLRARIEQTRNEKRRSALPEGESRDGAAEGMRAPGL